MDAETVEDENGDCSESWVAVSREHVADVDYEEGRLSTASSDESSVEEQLAEAVEENVENERQTSGDRQGVQVSLSLIDDEDVATSSNTRSRLEVSSKMLGEEERLRRSAEKETKVEDPLKDAREGVELKRSREHSSQTKSWFSLRGSKAFKSGLALFDRALPMLVCTHLLSFVIGVLVCQNWSVHFTIAR
ncbi:uncharacterized protein LOC134192307 [Corticium candelabrum]|uniref:uncharacterized protein LOC134192307 n=1 Tax=Corticium candelabrum TaxID=121492 RepID=UPI002E25C7A1|nr:uncharacterized protein LOC134192307 [Corticium candelabrum]